MSESHEPQERHAKKTFSSHMAMRGFVLKHRTVTFAATASLLTVSVLGFATAQGLMNADPQQAQTNESKHETRAEGKSVTTMTTTTNSSSASDNQKSPQGPKTNVVVNDQTIEVPQNGTVSKTITNDNGTTQVDVSNSSNGNSVSSSIITNNSSTSTNNYSQSLNITTSNSP